MNATAHSPGIERAGVDAADPARIEDARVEPADTAVPSRFAVAVVRRAAAGDAQAFGQLYEAAVDRIHRYVWLRVRDGGLAADLTQDIFVSALRGLPRLDDPERFEAWLLRIAHNRVVNHWVSAQRRGHDASLDADDDDEPGAKAVRNVADPAADALEETAERHVRLADLSRHLGVLSQAQQEVLALRFGTGLSLAKTAEQLGRSEMAIKQLQRRALVILRERMRPGEAAE